MLIFLFFISLKSFSFSFFVFFFYLFGDHRDLHSFPTRRSSDLARVEVAGEDEVERPGPYAVDHAREVADRKSTRLNSSHVEISYAVCCVKKKARTGDGKVAITAMTMVMTTARASAVW